jgi:probable addiction module antidote protein/putative addiction module killer protein
MGLRDDQTFRQKIPIPLPFYLCTPSQTAPCELALTAGDLCIILHNVIGVRQTLAYSSWVSGLRDRTAVLRIDVRIRRMSLGNFGDVRPVGNGVSELRIDYGPGYRVYFKLRDKRSSYFCAAATNRHRTGISSGQGAWLGKTVMALETTPWDPVDHLRSPEDERAYIEAAFDDGDPDLIAAAIGDVARARGMAQIAREAGISREAMYKSFRSGGNPTLDTIARVTRVLGLRLLVRTLPGQPNP